MSVVIGLIIFIVGCAAGFLAGRTMSNSTQGQRELEEQATRSEAALAQYKQDVAEHLDSSAQLLEKMNSTCQTAMAQMAESTKLLQQATTAEATTMPFFSKETQEQLAQTVKLRHQKRVDSRNESLSEPPLDYSANPSYLFADKKHSVTNSEEPS